MARRQNTAEDIINITSRLPWWVGVLLAAVSYVGLHSVAAKGLQHGQHDLSAAMQSGLIYTFASLGQYILPALFGIGAVISLFKVAKRKNLHGDVSSGSRKIAEVSWQDFELLIGEHFRRQGYSVQETSAGPDGGVDLILKENNATYVVQCKHYKAYKVGIKPVRELLGVMASTGAAGGYVVTSGEFTKDAIRFAESNNIELIDGKALAKIFKVTPKPAQQTPVMSQARTVQPMQAGETDSNTIDPSPNSNNDEVCPKCGHPLVTRLARKGSRAGQKFLGCTGYPNCKFTKPLD